MISVAATEILPEIMRSFSQKYPQVRYEVFTSTADIIRERIDKGILDIGMLAQFLGFCYHEKNRHTHRREIKIWKQTTSLRHIWSWRISEGTRKQWAASRAVC